eukprot:TRINITY_DN3009_c0_g1_i1.p8 TRINITY_DN3009_c0_g1~~TRINITY_DN3009_c0_g1_i1.p8  ORF type:complete len:142 (+),score=17.66 TRINITY_DN3009_c0_g1_i1:4103-4528(+)
MLNRNPKERINVTNALEHKWFQAYEAPGHKRETEKSLVVALRNLQNFEAGTTLQKAVLSYIAVQEIEPQMESELRNIFNALDVDRNGMISKKELLESYEKVYGSKSKALTACREVLRRGDVNKNGCIDYNGSFMMGFDQNS